MENKAIERTDWAIERAGRSTQVEAGAWERMAEDYGIARGAVYGRIWDWCVGKAYCFQHASHLPPDGSVGLILNTLPGPVVVGGAVGDVGHYKLYFEIGRAYF
jgi:hypothetical protein